MKKILTSIVGGITLAGGGAVVADQMQNPYTDKGNVYEMGLSNEIPQNDHVEIAKDKPSVVLSRWNNESRITIEPLFETGVIPTANRPFLTKRMEFSQGNIKAFVQPTATSSDFDIDFTLLAKPSSNVFNYKISGDEDADFFYQPAPTQAELDRGMERPDNVIGSYAVYSKSKRDHLQGATNYGTGKLFHIYRPKAIDAVGNEVWAILDYQKGNLSVTVPQAFLDTAVYPVTVDPTFGYTSIGATYEGDVSSGSDQRGMGMKGISLAGTVVSTSIALKATNAGVASIGIGVSNTQPDPFSVLSQNQSPTITTTGTFYTFSGSGNFNSATVYVGCRMDYSGSGAETNPGFFSDAGAGTNGFFMSELRVYSNVTTKNYSIYATYSVNSFMPQQGDF